MTEPVDREAALNAAPSELRVEEPTLARVLGLGGLALFVLGTVAVIANQYEARIVGTTGGIFATAIGIILLLYHAFRDGDIEFRRIYLALSILLLVAALIIGVVPGRPAGTQVESAVGYYLMPWAPLTALVGFFFGIAAIRHETNPKWVDLFHLIALVLGGVLVVAPVILGMVKPALLAGPGLLLGLVGLVALAAYLGRVGTNDGFGRLVGIALGLLGGTAAFYALARTVYPTVLFEGPKLLKTPAQTYDPVLLVTRVLLALALVYIASRILLRTTWQGFTKILVAIPFAITALVLLLGIVAAPLSTSLESYLVPGGLILGGLGLAYLAVSLGFCSDSPLVVQSVRELGGIFVSPIAYLVLFASTIASAIGYLFFLGEVIDQPGVNLPEPVVRDYWMANIGAALAVMIVVPLMTMRMFSEEKRSGTLEVLLTAPISESTIVLSKFFAALTFYMLVWLPLGLMLVGLRAAGGPFDYRPLLSYYLAHLACGAGFVAMGLLFSSLTRNQIIAAVLTFAGMFVLLLTVFIRQIPMGDIGPPIKAVAARFDYLSVWRQSLGGQLPLTTIAIYLSLAAFCLTATTKVLTARRWA